MGIRRKDEKERRREGKRGREGGLEKGGEGDRERRPASQQFTLFFSVKGAFSLQVVET